MHFSQSEHPITSANQNKKINILQNNNKKYLRLATLFSLQTQAQQQGNGLANSKQSL